MKLALLIVAGLGITAAAWRLFRRHRQRLAEAEALDREFRQRVIRRGSIQPRREEAEDYLLKLRAGGRSKTEPLTPPPVERNPNKFLD